MGIVMTTLCVLTPTGVTCAHVMMVSLEMEGYASVCGYSLCALAIIDMCTVYYRH